LKENSVCVTATFESFRLSKASFTNQNKFYSSKFSFGNGAMWVKTSVLVNNMEWSEEKVLQMIDELKECHY